MRLGRLVPGALCVLGTAGCGGTDPGARAATPPADPGKVLRAVRLMTSTPLDRGPVEVSPSMARRVTARVRRAVPLPAGGSFAGVRWEAAGAPIPRAHIAGVLELNAVCQWIRARREGREGATARLVLAAAARWPPIARVRFEDPAFVVSCYATHGREVAWARRRGRLPTS